MKGLQSWGPFSQCCLFDHVHPYKMCCIPLKVFRDHRGVGYQLASSPIFP